MKNSIIAMCVIMITTLNACAQTKHAHKDKKTTAVAPSFDSTNADVKTQISNVLNVYYGIKNALVADDDATTSQQAKAFRKMLELVDISKMNSAERGFFLPLQTKLDYDAEHIQGAPAIDHMREHFVSLSDNLFSVIKAFNATNGAAVYFAHCPMYEKGANWISSEEGIKNPYFGKQMLTCGKVTESIK